MSKSIERFRELTMLDGTSGFESEISKYLEENLSKYADEIKFDNLGGIYAIKKSKKENGCNPNIRIPRMMRPTD